MKGNEMAVVSNGSWRGLCVVFANASLALVIAGTMGMGCAREAVPIYAPAASPFDRAWNAALGAARDEGVSVASEDRASGTIAGARGDQEITIVMRAQADGSVRVEIGQRGPKDADPGLASRISRAYDRRMGR